MDSSDYIYVIGETDEDEYGGHDFFLIKFEENGSIIWTKKFGSTGGDTAYSATTDSFGNIYVTGMAEKSLDGKHHYGGQDIFLVKFNSSGVLQ